MALAANGNMLVANGYPVRLLPALESMMQGVIPKGIASVSAVVATESGTANAHIGLFAMPTTSGGNDNAVIAQTDILGLTSSQQTMTVAIPTTALPACYVVRVWVDSITGSNAETIKRDGSTATNLEPNVPVAVVVSSVTVA